MSETFYGIVAWFNSKSGFGFITRDDGKKDIFVHYSDISMEGFKTISANSKVSFEESNSFKEKLKAVNVKVLDAKKKE